MIEDENGEFNMSRLAIPGRKRSDKKNMTAVKSIRLGTNIMRRIDAMWVRKGFVSSSEFCRYAIRKELEYQEDRIYLPQVNGRSKQ